MLSTFGIYLAVAESPRIRKTEGKDEFEITYKKRYPVREAVDVALARAADDGFDAADQNKFEAQVEWDYKKMTLSISRSKKVSDASVGRTGLPDVKAARKMLIDDAPGKFNDFASDGLGQEIASKHKYTARFGRFPGVWRGEKASVEMWPVVIAKEAGTKLIVELSFKKDTADDSAALRSSLIEMLRGRVGYAHGTRSRRSLSWITIRVWDGRTSTVD